MPVSEQLVSALRDSIRPDLTRDEISHTSLLMWWVALFCSGWGAGALLLPIYPQLLRRF